MECADVWHQMRNDADRLLCRTSAMIWPRSNQGGRSGTSYQGNACGAHQEPPPPCASGSTNHDSILTTVVMVNSRLEGRTFGIDS